MFHGSPTLCMTIILLESGIFVDETFHSSPTAADLSQADVYSFAMICYELFEGRKPFDQMDAMSAARAASLFDRRPSFGRTNKCGMQPLGLKAPGFRDSGPGRPPISVSAALSPLQGRSLSF